MRRILRLFCYAAISATLLGSVWTNSIASSKETPTNPFDYNFCGGERVYPIVGANIATACGPRNQIALGRRGKISWIFPAHGNQPEAKGSYLLNKQQLAEMSVLAEVVMVAEPQPPQPGKVIYKMGINFSARKPAYVFAPLTEKYTPGNQLLQAMQKAVPDKPKLPDCGNTLPLFDPTMRLEERLQLIESAKKVRQ